MVYILIALFVVRRDKKEVITQTVGRDNTLFHHLCHITLAAPDRKLRCLHLAIFNDYHCTTNAPQVNRASFAMILEYGEPEAKKEHG